jgi:type IV pilus assembly protein PilA
MMYLKNNLNQAKQRFNTYVLTEVSIVISLIVVLVSFGTSLMPTFASKAELAEVLTSFPAFKATISQQYMETGNWPAKTELDPSQHYSKDLIKRIEFDGNGTINYFLNDRFSNLKNKTISFTATTSDSQQWENIIWICGYAKPLEGYSPQGDNLTDIDSSLLPSACKT